MQGGRFCFPFGKIERVAPLCANGADVRQFGNIHLLVDRPDRLFNEFVAVERNGISVLVIDIIPERLKFFSRKIFVEFVFGDLRLVGGHNDLRKHLFVEYALHKFVYPLRHRRDLLRKLRKSARFLRGAVSIGHVAVVVDISVETEIPLDDRRFLLANFMQRTADFDRFARKILLCRLGRPVVKRIFYFLLQASDKRLVTVARNHGQNIDIVYLYAGYTPVDAVAVAVDTEAHTPPHFLPLVDLAVALFKGAYLKYVRVVPPFAQG